MLNDGFKGDRVQIDKLTIGPGPNGAPVALVSVQFAAEDGTIHAVAQHSFLLDPEVATDAVALAATELLRLLTRKVERIHFHRPSEVESSSMRGIMESFRAMPDTPDEPGSQG